MRVGDVIEIVQKDDTGQICYVRRVIVDVVEALDTRYLVRGVNLHNGNPVGYDLPKEPGLKQKPGMYWLGCPPAREIDE